MRSIGEGNWDDDVEQKLGNAIGEALDDFGPDFDEDGQPLEEGESDRVRSEEERERPSRTEEAGQEEEEKEAATA
jgi:F-type H+-transporting ATPase subunit alpha